MNTKKIVLVISGILFLFVIILDQINVERLCSTNTCYSTIETYFTLSFLLIPVLLLSLITYKMRDEVFRAWWNFARWWVPVIIITTLLLENAGGGGTLGMNKDFIAFVLIILYSVLGIVSLVKIMRAYLRTKGK
ncbi:MAG: hypothetical protein NUV42_01960 [Candidatus Yonathbacteria bacterium]|nr:hypothetical protein [Candidatus Yonathbacteria bacterium]